MITLYGRKTTDLITLAEALRDCASRLEGGIALIYAPASCEFARFDRGRLINEEGCEIDLTSIFEARVFNAEAELRWLNKATGAGRAALISEAANLSELAEAIPPLKATDTIRQQYLLWGQGHDPAKKSEDWSILSEARIGTLLVPLKQLQPKQSVYLKTVEYLAEVDEYGNVAVVEERLLGLDTNQLHPIKS